MSNASAIAYQKRLYRCIAPRGHEGYLDIPADIEVRHVHEPCFMCGQREGCRHRVAA